MTMIEERTDLFKESPILAEISDLETHFFTYAGVVKALDKVKFNVYRGETLGIVGETGCGKSVTVRSIMGLVAEPGKIVGGSIDFHFRDGEVKNLVKLSLKAIREMRGEEISMIFQDPMTYMNPVMKVGDQVAEVIDLHNKDVPNIALQNEIKKLQEEIQNLTEKENTEKKIKQLKAKIEALEEMRAAPPDVGGKQRRAIIRQLTVETLKLVRLPNPSQLYDTYPHELSGGMRQRVMIAMGLSCNPDLLIADEATTALDVTIQAQILKLLHELKDETGTTLILVTHNLGVIAEQATRVLVMYAGNVVESAMTKELFANPQHPYTAGLLAAIPKLQLEKQDLKIIRGTVPNLITPPGGCRFHPRCLKCMPICTTVKPVEKEPIPGHTVMCHLFYKHQEEFPEDWNPSEEELKAAEAKCKGVQIGGVLYERN